MLWLLMTTGKCNLVCDYCGGSFPRDVVSWSVKYDISKLKSTIETRDRSPTVIFYGGEPLMNPKFIMKTMDSLNATRWGVQTNGTAVRMLPESYWKRMNVALLSIDGREQITDKHRGKGIYKRVVENASYLKSLGVETIARMAVTMDSDIYEEVKHLVELGVFDKIHWQLNVIWSERWDFENWAEKSYLPGLEKLMDIFMQNLSQGILIKIIPFLGVISAHFTGGYRGSPCGAGYSSITVTPEGRVLSCPIAVREKWAELGTVNEFRLLEDPLPDYCKTCDVKKYCGGRCLYASNEKYWGEEGFQLVDSVTKKYLRMVISKLPEIEKLIDEGVISKSSLIYDPVQDSTEVIP
ncbi:TIGR04084 family radical SAM/SPASM domain-containing protein [Sulfuracidifex tepidarius]|uniref:7-carboxy-7-deazaguanine synthase n=1 Tax=Sulfuracidifex tepidarius TaxID=1294262 RepID=A0A510DZ58_9CREN|nr:TIGR04084 family radical SAM/SPASM domain-containing protein [Sulfuracidifex tepidarius]BBG22745.1 7-carboxy-7-deazaguanine synthase [Sulfuracidifex tepidarius]BBG25524.1 7-carboxy-7-deazaguanine synthase [Sulfuracidifex tepidarius]